MGIFMHKDPHDTTLDLSAPEGTQDGAYTVFRTYEPDEDRDWFGIGISETLAIVKNGQFEPVSTARACYEAVRESYLNSDQYVEEGEPVAHYIIRRFRRGGVDDDPWIVVRCISDREFADEKALSSRRETEMSLSKGCEQGSDGGPCNKCVGSIRGSIDVIIADAAFVTVTSRSGDHRQMVALVADEYIEETIDELKNHVKERRKTIARMRRILKRGRAACRVCHETIVNASFGRIVRSGYAYVFQHVDACDPQSHTPSKTR